MSEYEEALEAWEAAQENEALRAEELKAAEDAHRISQDATRAAWVAVRDAEAAVQREREASGYADTMKQLATQVEAAAKSSLRVASNPRRRYERLG